jgi:hypothetical protein
MLSAVGLRAVSIGSMACGADPSVLLTAPGDLAAEAAEPRVEISVAGLVGVVAVAAVVVLVRGALQDVEGVLEGGELGEPEVPLHAELANSGSCGRASVIHAASMAIASSIA